MLYFHLQAPLFSAKQCLCVTLGTKVAKGKFVRSLYVRISWIEERGEVSFQI